MCVTLPFTKGCEQLAASEIEKTKKLAMIHVERVIGAIRQKYTILSRCALAKFFLSTKLGAYHSAYHSIYLFCWNSIK